MSAVAVKASVSGYHRFSVTDGTWATALGHLRGLMGGADVTVEYKDPAGDVVLIASVDEWGECLRVMKCPDNGLLELRVRPNRFDASDCSSSCEILSRLSMTAESNPGSAESIFASPTEIQPEETKADDDKESRGRLPTSTDPQALLMAMPEDKMGLRSMLLAFLALGEDEWNLASWGFKDEGARMVATVLKANPPARTLNFFNNGVGDEGAKALAEALKYNTHLQILNLQFNNIGNVGFAALAYGIACNNTLKKIYLCVNKFDRNVERSFTSFIRKKRQIEIVIVG